jgi:uncharacterized protein (TIGR02453 family)
MRYFEAETLGFLRDLQRHNDRAWFDQNKERYVRFVKEPLLEFIGDAAPELGTISRTLLADPRPVGGSMFRIYRDVRFSKDKSPYKTHAGAHFPSGGKGSQGPGYYFHLDPAGCFVGAGIWMPESATLQQIRERIAERPAEWKKARGRLNAAEDALQRAPRGFDPGDPLIEDIKRKSFTSSVPLTQAQVVGPNVMRMFILSCERMSPLMRFLAASVGASW